MNRWMNLHKHSNDQRAVMPHEQAPRLWAGSQQYLAGITALLLATSCVLAEEPPDIANEEIGESAQAVSGAFPYPFTDFPDFVWRSNAITYTSNWRLQRNASASPAFSIADSDILGAHAGDYRMVAGGDFDGDGVSDIVVRGTSAMYVWYINPDNSYRGYAFINNPIPVAEWQIRVVADFDKNGVPDLLWRSTSTGQNSIWYLARSGSSYIMSSWQYLPTVTPLSWDVSTAGDFDRDGDQDVIWSDTNTNNVWLMAYSPSNGLTIQGQKLVPALPGWNVVGALDFNGDRTSDLVLRNGGNGMGVWYLSQEGYFAGYDVLPNADSSYVPSLRARIPAGGQTCINQQGIRVAGTPAPGQCMNKAYVVRCLRQVHRWSYCSNTSTTNTFCVADPAYPTQGQTCATVAEFNSIPMCGRVGPLNYDQQGVTKTAYVNATYAYQDGTCSTIQGRVNILSYNLGYGTCGVDNAFDWSLVGCTPVLVTGQPEPLDQQCCL